VVTPTQISARATGPASLALAKLLNRVLSDYPLAGERLAEHALARIDVNVGPISAALRIAPSGYVEPAGVGTDEVATVSFHIPLTTLPQLLKKDAAAYQQIAVSGDSELAQLLSSIARNVEWDVEEDLSQLFGGGAAADIVSHRIVSTAKSFAEWREDAAQRLSENVAEYLVHERNAFVDQAELAQLVNDNQTLRDDVARLEARLNLLNPTRATNTPQ
jgi:ubiquinone biosynthesis accessory factor UbiJ